MNGRVYDPVLGRFLSADPTIQAPFLSQSLNRYSYVMNNPLSLIDPSGFSWLSKALHSVGSFLKKWGGTILAVALAFTGVGIIASGLIMGAYNSYMNGGNFLKNVVVGIVSAALGNAMGGLTSRLGDGFLATVASGALSGGVVGGATAVMMGGSFAEGFRAGAISGGILAGLAWTAGEYLFTPRGPKYASTNMDEVLITAQSKSSAFDSWIYKFYEKWNRIAAQSGTGVTYKEMKQHIIGSNMSDGAKAEAFSDLHDQMIQLGDMLESMADKDIRILMSQSGDSGDPFTWQLRMLNELYSNAEDASLLTVAYATKVGIALENSAYGTWGGGVKIQSIKVPFWGFLKASRGIGDEYNYTFRFCGASWCR